LTAHLTVIIQKFFILQVSHCGTPITSIQGLHHTGPAQTRSRDGKGTLPVVLWGWGEAQWRLHWLFYRTRLWCSKCWFSLLTVRSSKYVHKMKRKN